MHVALERAQEALQFGRAGLALALLASVEAEAWPTSDPSFCRQLRQLQALCRIELAGPSRESWLQLLGFGEGHTAGSTAEVRRRYRQLAAAVHPDKCALPGAAHAFQKLQQGLEQLLGEGAGEAGWGGQARDAKRRRREQGGEEGGLEDAFDDNWLASDNGGFPWWSEWDAPPGPPSQVHQQAAPQQLPPTRPDPGLESGATPIVAERKEHQHGVGGPSNPAQGAGDGQPSPGPSEAEADEGQLGGLGLEELRAEVRRRQDALLGPPGGGGHRGGEQGPRPSMQQLQARLRRARAVLASRLQQQKASPVAILDGGFLRGH